jgi:hypothetical protein
MNTELSHINTYGCCHDVINTHDLLLVDYYKTNLFKAFIKE